MWCGAGDIGKDFHAQAGKKACLQVAEEQGQWDRHLLGGESCPLSPLGAQEARKEQLSGPRAALEVLVMA